MNGSQRGNGQKHHQIVLDPNQMAQQMVDAPIVGKIMRDLLKSCVPDENRKVMMQTMADEMLNLLIVRFQEMRNDPRFTQMVISGELRKLYAVMVGRLCTVLQGFFGESVSPDQLLELSPDDLKPVSIVKGDRP